MGEGWTFGRMLPAPWLRLHTPRFAPAGAGRALLKRRAPGPKGRLLSWVRLRRRRRRSARVSRSGTLSLSLSLSCAHLDLAAVVLTRRGGPGAWGRNRPDTPTEGSARPQAGLASFVAIRD